MEVRKHEKPQPENLVFKPVIVTQPLKTWVHFTVKKFSFPFWNTTSSYECKDSSLAKTPLTIWSEWKDGGWPVFSKSACAIHTGFTECNSGSWHFFS